MSEPKLDVDVESKDAPASTGTIDVELTMIRANPVALRDVDRESEIYQGIVASIREKGFNSSITVREKKDSETDALFYEICDGLHRCSAARDAGVKAIPCHIIKLDDEQLLEWQVMANVHKVDTKPAEYAKQLQRMFAAAPMLTNTEMANKVAKSPAWINKMLGLLKLPEAIQKLINDSKIKVSNAFQLAKLPEDELETFIERAMTDAPQKFAAAVTARKKEINEARKAGKAAKPEEFTPYSHLRKKTEIDIEREDMSAALKDVLATSGAKTAIEGAIATLKWICHLDPASVKQQEEDWIARKDAEKAKRDKRKAERDEKKKQEASDEAANVKADMTKAGAK